MWLVFIFFWAPVAAYLVMVALPRRAGLALALVVALTVAAGGLVYAVPGGNSVEDAEALDLTLLAALFWGGTAVAAGVLQAARPVLKRLGRAAYPLAVSAPILALLLV